MKIGFNDAERTIEPAISDTAKRILEKRYLRKDAHGNIVETPEQMFWRVARCVAAAEQQYAERKTKQYWEQRFYETISELLFLPNSPTLFNAERDPQMLSACFVLPVPGSLEGILQVTKEAGLIQKSGGGVGFDFSALRPKGAIVRSTAGVASGPVSFMKGINAWAQVIKQGGLRRAANMAVLSVHHPDIEEFIRCKTGNYRTGCVQSLSGDYRRIHDRSFPGRDLSRDRPADGQRTKKKRCSKGMANDLRGSVGLWGSGSSLSRYHQCG